MILCRWLKNVTWRVVIFGSQISYLIPIWPLWHYLHCKSGYKWVFSCFFQVPFQDFQTLAQGSIKWNCEDTRCMSAVCLNVGICLSTVSRWLSHKVYQNPMIPTYYLIFAWLKVYIKEMKILAFGLTVFYMIGSWTWDFPSREETDLLPTNICASCTLIKYLETWEEVKVRNSACICLSRC